MRCSLNAELFPQYTAKRNVSLAADLSELRALKTEKLPRKEKSALKKQIREKNDENARRLLEKVGLAEKCAAYPCELSGGQRRRVELARAFAAPGELVLLDEPFGGLDAQAHSCALAFVKRHGAGRIVVFTTHDANDAPALTAQVLEL